MRLSKEQVYRLKFEQEQAEERMRRAQEDEQRIWDEHAHMVAVRRNGPDAWPDMALDI